MLLSTLTSTIFSLVVGGQAATKKPSMIIYQPDEIRAEALGCYGHPVSKTPNFDAFAEQGTRFDQAHVSYTVCSQSRVAFMTGWPTHVGGHRSLWALLHDWEPHEAPGSVRFSPVPGLAGSAVCGTDFGSGGSSFCSEIQTKFNKKTMFDPISSQMIPT